MNPDPYEHDDPYEPSDPYEIRVAHNLLNVTVSAIAIELAAWIAVLILIKVL